MESSPINMELFCKFPKIDFNSLELKPSTNLNFCTQQTQVSKKEKKLDQRYLENDSRYITPEDRARYEEEFIQMKKEREQREEEFMRSHFTLHRVNHFEDYPEENEMEVNDENDDEEEDNEESDEEFYDEYEFKTGHKNKM